MRVKATVTVSSKGQIVLPLAIRKSLNIDKGDLLILEVVGDRIVLTPSKRGAGRAGEERVKLLEQTAGSLPELDPGYVYELRKSSAERLERWLDEGSS
jgi:AbrB family looped-hinge helix DNA binding protein